MATLEITLASRHDMGDDDFESNSDENDFHDGFSSPPPHKLIFGFGLDITSPNDSKIPIIAPTSGYNSLAKFNTLSQDILYAP